MIQCKFFSCNLLFVLKLGVVTAVPQTLKISKYLT